jgi:tetratricopeptide (TPR) repeat protein
MYVKANQMWQRGNLIGARDMAYEIKSFNSHYASNIASSLLINIGDKLRDENTIQDGIDLLEDLKKKGDFDSFLYYNLGNGYYDLFTLKYDEKKSNHHFKSTELDKAKINYRKALDSDQITPEMFINLANCYDHLGMVIDALENYDNALLINPSHPMALGNKGMAFYNYSRLTGENGTFLIEAYSLLSSALEILLSYESENAFFKTLKLIENIFPDKKVLLKHLDNKKYEIKAESKLEKDLTQFCLDNKLYLNICNYCQRCNNAIGDPIRIQSMVESMDQVGESFENSRYYQLSAYLNQIKQDYVTTRFLLFLSRYDDLDLSVADKNVTLINILDYSKYTINIQLLKFAFKNLYDILDKIAFFIEDYINLGMKKNHINFMKIWYDQKSKDIPKNIRNTNNPSLNAIFMIYEDFKPNGPYRKLKDIRNALTHRFIRVKAFGEQNDEDILEEQFVEYTFELAKIVRNAIIYLLCFVNSEEAKKKKEINGPIGTLIADEIPDELKNF